jgi:phenylpropionate dioxygenase-like ring-hydroxylating dioxygenase large terminal subunit
MPDTHQKADDVPYLTRLVPNGLELGLRNYWYPVIHSQDLTADKPYGFKALNEKLVAWRSADGTPNVVADRCPHRAASLSCGRVMEGDLQCAWHGVRFNGEGRCTVIPWEPATTPLLGKISVHSYPARDLAGWIWAYIGDTVRFPPPRLEDVMPEELLKPDEFVVFRHPVDVWKCNWLQAIDGSDGYHAVMLHGHSQPVAKKEWQGGAVERPPVSLADRRVRILDTPQGLRGVAVDRSGESIHHGHLLEGWKGERWTLPCLFTLPIQPAPNLPIYVPRLYQFAIDATHTQTSRWVSMRAKTQAERDRCVELWEKVVGPRQRQVVDEDKEISESLPELAETRNNEFLFNADREVVQLRRMMEKAWLEQLAGKRVLPTPEALAFPV